MFPKRAGLIVWVNDIKHAKNLERFGNVLYISGRLKYANIYVNEAEIESKISYIEKLHFVKKVERSYRTEMHEAFSRDSIEKS